ncbi:MAG TPA: methyltransferase domain-containing protein [Hanamia sp.]
MRLIYRFIIKLVDLLKIGAACVDSKMAQRYGKYHNAPGMLFDDFGRRLGRRICISNPGLASQYLFCPMHLFRYWEFDFAYRQLPQQLDNILDVSSPRLLSLMIGSEKTSKILMINPDLSDLQETEMFIQSLHLKNVTTMNVGIEAIQDLKEEFDCIMCISVIEHIDGAMDDSAALKIMYDALRPNGRLIITIPVDKNYYEEFSDSQQYGTQPKIAEGKYFFQRIYDWDTINSRIIDKVGTKPKIHWFGEKISGHYRAYSNYRSQEGFVRRVNDPKELVDNFQEFESWEAMPGLGICGMAFIKDIG